MRLSNEDGGGSMKEEFKIRLSRLSVRSSLGLSTEWVVELRSLMVLIYAVQTVETHLTFEIQLKSKMSSKRGGIDYGKS